MDNLWISIEEGSALLGIPAQQLRLMLRSKEFPFLGFAFLRPNSKRWSYYVSKEGILSFRDSFSVVR